MSATLNPDLHAGLAQVSLQITEYSRSGFRLRLKDLLLGARWGEKGEVQDYDTSPPISASPLPSKGPLKNSHLRQSQLNSAF
jgi:hypothetical protein